jgi:pimeloyl-ACP methyl ester carboxylesterase
MPFASVNGQQLYFEDTAGTGPVVVFSHGNLMNSQMWAPQVEAMRGEFRCVVWDARLHGRTKDDGDLYTYWDSADDLLGLLDHLGRPVDPTRARATAPRSPARRLGPDRDTGRGTHPEPDPPRPGQ